MKSEPDTDFAKLIPELPTWNNGEGISVESWVGCLGSFELAVGYSRLFWPDFVEHLGAVFFAGFSVESYLAFKEQFEGDLRRLEGVMNHRHICEYFSHECGSVAPEQLVYLGRILKDIWGAKLARDFPDRQFIVSFPEGPFDDPLDYEISFWQKPSARNETTSSAPAAR